MLGASPDGSRRARRRPEPMADPDPAPRPSAATPTTVWLLCLGIPLLLLAATDAVLWSLEAGERFTGYHRQDFIYYSSNAREVFDNGNGLLYGYPFSASASAPRVYSHLQLLVLGWAWKLTGVALPILWQLAQLLCGAAMLLTLWRLLGLLLPARGRVYGFAVVALGGGLAVPIALAQTFLGHGGEPEGFLRTVHEVGGGWFPNVFQNALLTTEAFYHALAFWTFAAVLRGERGRVLLGVFGVFWAHPFTGLEVAAIVGVFAAVEALRERDRASLRHAAAIALVSGAFLFYYVFGLRLLSNEAADILDRWRTAPYLLELSRAPAMWGVFLLGLVLPWVPSAPGPRIDPRGDRGDRFLVVWLGVVALLLLHDRLLPEGVEPYQPLHFAHGYFFVPLAVLTMRALGAAAAAWPPRRRRAAAAAFLAFVALDNAAFTAGVLLDADKPVLTPDVAAVLDRLAEEPEPATVLTLGRVPLFRDMLGVSTPHRTYLLNAFQTAWFGRKRQALREIATGDRPAALAAELGIEWVVGPAVTLAAFDDGLRAGRVEPVLRSGELVLLRVRLPIAERAPDYEVHRFPPALGGPQPAARP